MQNTIILINPFEVQAGKDEEFGSFGASIPMKMP